MDKAKLKEIVEDPSNYVVEWKTLCLLQKEHKINLFSGLSLIMEDFTLINKILPIFIPGHNLTEELIEENLSLSSFEKIMENVTKGYLKHFGDSSKNGKRSGK